MTNDQIIDLRKAVQDFLTHWDSPQWTDTAETVAAISVMRKALAHWDRNSQMSSALQFPGMTLLDHFAGLAMQGMLAASENYPTPELAGYAYQVADAMLKERQKWIK